MPHNSYLSNVNFNTSFNKSHHRAADKMNFKKYNMKNHRNKRMSLITGKQLLYTPMNRHGIRYRRVQLYVYNFLERPAGKPALMYQLIIFISVFVCLVLSVLATIPEYEVESSFILMNAEIVIVIWLSIELSLRVWSSGCRSRYQTWKGRIKFMKNVFCLLDLTVIVASIALTVIATNQNKHKNFAAAAFRGLRFFQILRMLRVDRRAGTWRLLGTVVWAHRQELITTFYIGFLSLIISSFIMYLLEKDHPDTLMSTYADSLWWGVITLCTIGYGDVYPKTASGKLLASGCALVGISFFALPAGILGSGFALKVQAMQRQKHLNRRRAPAATLIQCVWRCYASDPTSLSEATWKPSMKALEKERRAAYELAMRRQNSQINTTNSTTNPSSQPPQMAEYSIANLVKPIRNSSTSFLNRVTSIKRATSPQVDRKTASFKIEHDHVNNKSYLKTNSLNLSDSIPNTNKDIPLTTNINPNIFNGRTSVCSFDGVVSSPETTCGLNEVDSLCALNNNNHTINNCAVGITMEEPISTICIEHEVQEAGRNPKQISISEQKSSKITPIKSSFAHRTLNFFSDFNSTGGGRSDDHENTSKSDHEKYANILTMQHKHAIRAMRKIRYFVARRKFREALRPYDVTDVIEQYSAGNLDMLARIKTLQFRLDKILGSSKSKDCYDSHSISLATRIVKVERQMDNISIKFDRFFTGYSSDMKMLMDTFRNHNLENQNHRKDNSIEGTGGKSRSNSSSLRYHLETKVERSEEYNKKLKQLKLRGFPIRKSSDDFSIENSSIQGNHFDNDLALLESINDSDYSDSDMERVTKLVCTEKKTPKKPKNKSGDNLLVTAKKVKREQMTSKRFRTKSDSELSLKSVSSKSQESGSSSMLTKGRKHSKTFDNGSFNLECIYKSNLSDKFSKSDILISDNKNSHTRLDTNFTKLLKKKTKSESEEIVKFNYPKIYISKPKDICNENEALETDLNIQYASVLSTEEEPIEMKETK